MKYTKDNPKLVNHYNNPEEDDFTGVVKDIDGFIAYYENDELHRGDGPAIEYANCEKHWYYNGKLYGWNSDFTVESWIKKWKLDVFK